MNKSVLQTRGYRMTPQRMAILRILTEASLQESGHHMTPLEVCHKAQQELPGLTEPTVYRTLSFLTEQGLVLAAHIGSGQLVYEIAQRDHHHLICRECGGTCEISHDLLKSLYEQLNLNTGFQIDSMHVTFFGLCPGCQQKRIASVSSNSIRSEL
jgi:Fe2+ or Zn2+ uptake regulation protein